MAILAALMLATAVNGAELALELSGTAFEGGPAFEIKIGGEVVGTGTIDPIPPAGDSVHFLFEVDDTVLARGGDLSIRLSNDRRAGPGADRNLHILFVRVNDHDFAPEDLRIVNRTGPVVRPIRQGRLELWTGDEVALGTAPRGGWIGKRLSGDPGRDGP
ncbi:MAG: hypothetical protein IPK28_06800 [Devosia sp.]|nr:hypothetical protein [Devosia sp.]